MCSRGGRSLFHGTLLISADLEAMSEALKPDENKLMGHGVKSVRSRVANLSEYTKEEVRPDIIGAMLAAPVCLVVMRLFFVTERSFWQELAWLFSAVFWCALGALCFLFICAWLDTRRRHSSEE